MLISRKMQPPKIPFNRPYTTGDEFGYIQEAIDNLHLSGNGPLLNAAPDGWRSGSGATARS
jgi:hypothetical protein